jgi:hypothetical protein
LRPRNENWFVRDEEGAGATLAHGRQHFLGDQEGSTARDVLRRLEDLDRDVFQQLLVRRQVTPLQVAGVVDEDIGVTGVRADRGERARDRLA